MQTLTGSVLKNKNAKTLLIGVTYVVTHPLYHKQFKRTSRLQVQNDLGEVAVGSLVKIVSTRPVSKNKSFKLLEVVQVSKPEKEPVEVMKKTKVKNKTGTKKK